MAERDGRERIRSAAERLIGERGVDVPLRDITIAAGQRNNSAIQYHFGSRDQLIEAIVDHWLGPLEARRLELFAVAGAVDDVRGLIEVLVAPMLEIPYQHGATHYARFLEQVRNHAAVSGLARLQSLQRPATRIILARLERALGDLAPAVRRLRLAAMGTALFSFLADHERASEAGDVDATAHDLAAANLVDMLVALLTAEPSPAALAAAKSRRRRARTA